MAWRTEPALCILDIFISSTHGREHKRSYFKVHATSRFENCLRAVYLPCVLDCVVQQLASGWVIVE
jgi:hypothetical protein